MVQYRILFSNSTISADHFIRNASPLSFTSFPRDGSSVSHIAGTVETNAVISVPLVYKLKYKQT